MNIFHRIADRFRRPRPVRHFVPESDLPAPAAELVEGGFVKPWRTDSDGQRWFEEIDGGLSEFRELHTGNEMDANRTPDEIRAVPDSLPSTIYAVPPGYLSQSAGMAASKPDAQPRVYFAESELPIDLDVDACLANGSLRIIGTDAAERVVKIDWAIFLATHDDERDNDATNRNARIRASAGA